MGKDFFLTALCNHIHAGSFTIWPQLAHPPQEGTGHLLCHHREPCRHDARLATQRGHSALHSSLEIIVIWVPMVNSHHGGS